MKYIQGVNYEVESFGGGSVGAYSKWETAKYDNGWFQVSHCKIKASSTHCKLTNLVYFADGTLDYDTMFEQLKVRVGNRINEIFT